MKSVIDLFSKPQVLFPGTEKEKRNKTNQPNRQKTKLNNELSILHGH